MSVMMVTGSMREWSLPTVSKELVDHFSIYRVAFAPQGFAEYLAVRVVKTNHLLHPF